MGIILGKDRLYKEIEDNLFYAADNKTLSHAFIFEGPKESKKMEMAWGLSKKILKTEHLENCSDYFLIDNDKMNIETIRFINKDCYIKPYKDKKVYIFEDAMKLTAPMQNAFLKTLEEPPSDVLFILICENASILLETIRSRCISYYFPGEDSSIEIDSELRMQVENCYKNLLEKNQIGMIQYIEDIKNQKDDIDKLLDMFMDYTRDILITKERSDYLAYCISDDELVDKVASSFTHFQLLTIIDIIDDTRKKLSSRCNFNLTCEAMLFNIMEVVK